jgi:ABC-type nitrate/sulfonate/bicarbonate transport system ATPase subunit
MLARRSPSLTNHNASVAISISPKPVPRWRGPWGGWGREVSGEEADITVRTGAHISVQDLTHRYGRADVNAVEEVSLEIAPGSAAALIGRSGCGKSTLLHLISGLQQPTHGAVRIDGRLVTGPSPSWIVMFQQASLFPWMTVTQNVALGLRFARRMREAKTRVGELLELVELSAYADRNVQDLSGGQQQRVALARSLAVRPHVLLLDEPFSALDTFTRSALQRDVRRICKDIGITLILVTHDINEAVLMADRAIVMAADPGRIMQDLPIGLDDAERARPGAAFRAAREKLQSVFESVVGAETELPAVPAAAGGNMPASPSASAVAV